MSVTIRSLAASAMKVIFVSVALLCGALRVTGTPVKCGSGDTLLANPDDCSTFYICDNGVARLTSCPPTLYFNPDALVCDRQENVACLAPTEAPEEPTTVSELPTTDEEEPITEQSTPVEESTTEKPITDEPSSTSEEEATTVDVTSSTEPEEPTTEEPDETSATPRPSTTTTKRPTTTTRRPTTTTRRPTTTTRRPTTTTRRPTTSTTKRPTTITTTEQDETTVGGEEETTTEEQDLTTEAEESTTVSEEDEITSEEPSTTEGDEGSSEEPSTTEGDENTSEESSTTEGDEGSSEEPSTTEGDENTSEESSTTEGNEVTTELPGFKPDCPKEGLALFDNPESCSSFFICFNGNYGIINCPAGFDYNPATFTCDLPADPQCHAISTTTPAPYVPPCPENGTEFFSNPSDCSSYYICINNNYALLSCPANFYFNSETKACVHSDQFTCNEVQVLDLVFQCEEDGTFPDPDDCGSYYVCNGNLKYPMQCPGGLHFDIIIGGCNTPELANCQVTPATSTTSTSTSTSTTSQPSSSTTTTTIRPTSPTSTTTSSPTTSKPGSEPECPPEGQAIFPDLEDCTSFFVCIDGKFGEIECPPGYAFNPELGNCDLAENVQCNPSAHPDCPAEGTAKVPNPLDCTSYFFCINGQSALIQCPEGLQYDEVQQVCSPTAQCSTQPSTPAPSSSTTTQKPSSTTTTTTTTTTPKPTTTTTTVKPTSAPTECKQDGQFLPNPESCSSFFQCANGEPIKTECPPGLEFNAKLSVCDTPENANCQVQNRLSLSQFFGLYV